MRLHLVGAVLTVGALMLASVNATASAPLPPDRPPAAVSNPNVPLSLIKALPQVIQNNTTIKIDPCFDPTIPLVYADGSIVPGQSARSTQAAAACTKAIWGPPWPIWSGVVDGPCGVAGSPGFQLTYRFSTAGGVSSSACVQGTGWVGSTQTWYSIGCGQRGSAWVPWDNVLAQPKLKVVSQNPHSVQLSTYPPDVSR